jgi:hypothetical protein
VTDRPTAVPVRPGERSTTAFRVTFALATFIAVAIVKPWGDVAQGPSGQGDAARSPTIAGSSDAVAQLADASVEPVPAAATSCLSSDAEQLVVVERWPGNEVRSWIAVDQVAASGPLDPALGSIDVFAAHAVALGVCAPSEDQAGSAAPSASHPGRQHAATILDVETIAAGSAARPVDVGAPIELPGLGDGPDTVRLYGPPVAASAAEPTASSGGQGPTKSSAPAQAGSSAAVPGTAGSSPAAGGSQALTADSSAAGPAPASAKSSPAPPTSEPTTDSTWALGSYAVAFRFPFDTPATTRWLRFNLVRGGGG